MEGPPQITPTGPADYLDVMSKAVFQSGMSWRVVEAKWAGTREAFFGFDPVRLIDLTPDEVDELARDTRLIRNRRKIEATIQSIERSSAAAKLSHANFSAELLKAEEVSNGNA